jgi:CheY-like chemotaxis protein
MSAERPRPDREGQKRVVIIDDEEDVATYLAALLSDNGYEVHTAADGREGLEIVKSTKPDLVCLDILMPVETGISLYRKIKADPTVSTVPVIIISGMNYGEQVGGKDDPAADDIPEPEHYLEKPVKPAQFLETVRAIIG